MQCNLSACGPTIKPFKKKKKKKNEEERLKLVKLEEAAENIDSEFLF